MPLVGAIGLPPQVSILFDSAVEVLDFTKLKADVGVLLYLSASISKKRFQLSIKPL